MSGKSPGSFRPSRKTWIYTVVALAALSLLFAAITRFNFTGQLEGIFLLKGKKGHLFELKDDLYLGDGSRLLLAIDFDRLHLNRRCDDPTPGKAYLYYEWDAKIGDGFVRNFMPDGTKLLTCFGRFDEGDDRYYKGLFVGGGLPANVRGDSQVTANETGMAYHDGKRWYHLWCNVNEGLASGTTPKLCPPYEWKFLGSRVLNEGCKSLALESSHEAMVDGVPLRIDRHAYFKAGDTFFILSIRIKNMGDRPVSYCYVYGDEPWVGDYGTSAGNIGWVDGHVIITASWVDTTKYKFAGIFDYGNTLIGEGHNYTKVANFIEWLGKNVPAVYFSNGTNQYPPKDGSAEPLGSNERYIGLQWGPTVLKPGQSEIYALAIGMAGKDRYGFPVKPKVNGSGIP